MNKLSEEEEKRLIEEAVRIMKSLIAYADLISNDIEKHLNELEKMSEQLWKIREKLSLGAEMDVYNAWDDVKDLRFALARIVGSTLPKFKVDMEYNIKFLLRWVKE